MIYLYDTVLTSSQTVLRRFGVNYKLESKSLMGDRIYYSFVYPGREKILVIPGFMEQYNKAKKLIAKFPKKATLEKYITLIRSRLGPEYEVEEIPNENCKSGFMTVIKAEYMDIHIECDLIDGVLVLNPEFEIFQNNLFDGRVSVMTGENLEEK